jgi:HEAT repeat protein
MAKVPDLAELPMRVEPPVRRPDELLPPVTPPTGRFIVQLFIIPAVIVTVIVLLWLLLTGVVLRRSGNPDELIKSLAGGAGDRWQDAQQLADMLRDERHADFKRNTAAAGQLAQIIDRKVGQAERGEEISDHDVTLVTFAARALGEFHVDVGLPTLLRAASLNEKDEKAPIRRAAIEAIAVLTTWHREQDPAWRGEEYELEDRLLELASSEHRLVRSETGVALGALATPAAMEKLAELVRDPYPDARYNAALALARLGDLRAVSTLAEMLDPDETAGLRYEDERAIYRLHKRSTILVNALRVTELLASSKPRADYDELMESLEKLVKASPEALGKAYIEPPLVSEAERILRYLRKLAGPEG